MSKVSTLERLENILSHWEQTCDIAYFNALLSANMPERYIFDLPIDGPLGHARTLRQHILTSEEFDYKKYVFGQNEQNFFPKWKNVAGPLYSFPIALFRWCKSSRRVYRLTEELTNLLRMTSVEDVEWRDIQFPFHSYIIEIENGFVDSTGAVHDFFMVEVYIEDGKKKFTVISIARKEGLFKIFPIQQVAEIRQLINNRKYDKAYRRIDQLNKTADCNACYFVAPFHIEDDETNTVKSSIDRFSNNMISKHGESDEFVSNLVGIANQALRIICGFSLYLKTLPPGSPHISEWNEITASTKCGKVIADGAQICSVSSSVKFSSRETEAIKEHFSKPCGHEMPAHFREGHWRRPPGKGNDPAALKTVWVRPCIVRMDRLPEGTLPVGMVQAVG